MRSGCCILLFSLLALCLQPESLAQDSHEAAISENELGSLRNELYAAREASSKTGRRRAYKNAVRSAKSLLAKHPDALNRYSALELLFVSQQQLVMLDNSERNRSDFFATCDLLMEAPAAYAKARLQAELLLMRRKLAAPTVTDAQRLHAIATLADRYRDTEAEAESLMISSLYIRELSNQDLLEAMLKKLSRYFGDKPEVATFLREKMAFTKNTRVQGRYSLLGGKEVDLTEGLMYVAVYWSQDMAFVKERLNEIKAAQERFPNQFDVYSLNVDGLADGGKSFLADLGCNLKILMVPPQKLKLIDTLVVDEYGWSHASAHRAAHSSIAKKVERHIGNGRSSQLLLSLRAGEFLLEGLRANAEKGVSAEEIQALRDTLVLAPYRYDLTVPQALEMYKEIDSQCAQISTDHEGAENLWTVHNYRVVALMGLWRLTRDPGYLEKAKQLAERVLESKASSADRIIAQLCLAYGDLNDNQTKADLLLEKFITACGGEKSGARAHGAALLLAFAAQSRTHYETYRDLLLGRFANDSKVWTLSSFLLDPVAAKAVFEKAFLADVSKDKRREDIKPVIRSFNEAFLEPHFDSDRVNTVVFSRGDNQNVFKAAHAHSHVIAVSPENSRAAIAGIMKKNPTVKTVFLDAAEWSRVTRRWGVFGADKKANAFALRPDKSIIVAVSDLSTSQPEMRLKKKILQYKLDLSDASLFEGDYATYIKEVNDSFPLNMNRVWYDNSFEDQTTRHRLKQIWTYIQLKDWEKALASANENIDIHMHPPKNKYFKNHCPACTHQVTWLARRLAVVKEMGNADEAKKTEALLKAAACPPGNPEIKDGDRGMPGGTAASRLSHIDTYLRTHLGSHGSNERMVTLVGSLMLRAQIYDATNQPALAAQDRERAEAQSYPHPPKEFDPRTNVLAANHRRTVAAEAFKNGQAEEALRLINENIRNHEAEAVRRQQGCYDCAWHVVALQQRPPFLKELGWDTELKTNEAMLKALVCPTGSKESVKVHFPRGYLFSKSEKGPKGKIDFISDYMKGGNYSIGGPGGQAVRDRRFSVGNDLALRTKIYEEMNEKDKAESDRYRAMAAKFPLDLEEEGRDNDVQEKPYVDLIGVEVNAERN